MIAENLMCDHLPSGLIGYGGGHGNEREDEGLLTVPTMAGEDCKGKGERKKESGRCVRWKGVDD